jgi:hypothetical protein
LLLMLFQRELLPQPSRLPLLFKLELLLLLQLELLELLLSHRRRCQNHHRRFQPRQVSQPVPEAPEPIVYSN